MGNKYTVSTDDPSVAKNLITLSVALDEFDDLPGTVDALMEVVAVMIPYIDSETTGYSERRGYVAGELERLEPTELNKLQGDIRIIVKWLNVLQQRVAEYRENQSAKAGDTDLGDIGAG